MSIDSSTSSTSRIERLRNSTALPYLIQIGVAIAIFVIGSILVPGFSRPSALQSIAVLASFLGIAALGQTLVVLIGGIDLSIPALIGAGNVITAKLTGDGVPWPLTFAIVVAVGLGVGALNGQWYFDGQCPPLWSRLRPVP